MTGLQMMPKAVTMVRQRYDRVFVVSRLTFLAQILAAAHLSDAMNTERRTRYL